MVMGYIDETRRRIRNALENHKGVKLHWRKSRFLAGWMSYLKVIEPNLDTRGIPKDTQISHWNNASYTDWIMLSHKEVINVAKFLQQANMISYKQLPIPAIAKKHYKENDPDSPVAPEHTNGYLLFTNMQILAYQHENIRTRPQI